MVVNFIRENKLKKKRPVVLQWYAFTVELDQKEMLLRSMIDPGVGMVCAQKLTPTLQPSFLIDKCMVMVTNFPRDHLVHDQPSCPSNSCSVFTIPRLFISLCDAVMRSPDSHSSYSQMCTKLLKETLTIRSDLFVQYQQAT